MTDTDSVLCASEDSVILHRQWYGLTLLKVINSQRKLFFEEK